ncbi:hypothetical protein TanjilG_31585 [Lupinus angustifolius]|uniref:Uncharacterized protein n=1 Tax=Lupinus angustifolius TaxID=3871 RepID=A0A394DEC4_LUPAN|nr:hypothetical protein TanjilG_31585 [Lupinus angustifolius]
MEHNTKVSNNNMKKHSAERNMGHAVHSQVLKIKQEIAKFKEPSLQLQMRRALIRDVSRNGLRSPLGLGGERTILVGKS